MENFVLVNDFSNESYQAITKILWRQFCRLKNIKGRHCNYS